MHTHKFCCDDRLNHIRACSCECVRMSLFTLGTGLVIMNWYSINKTSQCGLDPSWVYTHRDFTCVAAEGAPLLLLLLLLLSVRLPTVCLCDGWLCHLQIGTDTNGRKVYPHVLTCAHKTHIHLLLGIWKQGFKERCCTIPVITVSVVLAG